jgi:hypothetical protein
LGFNLEDFLRDFRGFWKNLGNFWGVEEGFLGLEEFLTVLSFLKHSLINLSKPS